MKQITIVNVKINQNESGLYSLNDLHKASGGDAKKRPYEFLRTDRAKRLVSALESKTGYPVLDVSHGGASQGTFGHRHVLVAYAQWLSVEIEIMVQDAFIEKVWNTPQPDTNSEYRTKTVSNLAEFVLEKAEQLETLSLRVEMLENGGEGRGLRRV